MVRTCKVLLRQMLNSFVRALFWIALFIGEGRVSECPLLSVLTVLHFARFSDSVKDVKRVW